MARSQSDEEHWRSFLLGTQRGLAFGRKAFGRLPSPPRCKLCHAPFGSPGRQVMRLFGGGPSTFNRRICRWCIAHLAEHPGGAEVEITALLADVRGSTGLAERLSAEEFSRLMARFYGTAARVVDAGDGIVDKFVGDEVVALFIPGLAGEDHAAHAVGAARRLLDETEADADGGAVAIGVGVHTGVSYVGAVGEGDALDFTALGDTVNTAARLTSVAAAGEILVSDAAAVAAALDTAGLEHRTLALRGREQAIGVWVAASREPQPASGRT